MIESLVVMDTKKLILRAKSGDREAFGQLYSQFYVPVFRYIYLRVSDKKEAEDLTQEVFLKTYRSIDRYRDTGSDPLAYFFTVARNSVIDFYRKKKETSLEGNEEVLQIPDFKNDPEEEFSKSETKEKIMKAISHLSDEQKEVVILKFINDLPNSEIAQLLNKNEPAIRQIQHRALENLGKILKD